MALQFTTVSRSAQNAFINALIYGGPGVGKTVLMATLGPGTIIISAESGLLSLRRRNLERLFGANNPAINYDLPVIEVKSPADFQEALAWLKHSHEARQFHTAGLDSLSEIAEVLLNSYKRTTKDPRQAYGQMSEVMESAVRDYRDLPGKNIVMSAKLEQYKDELTGVMKYGPSMPGRKLGPNLPYFFDEVFRVGVSLRDPQGNSYRFLQCQPDMQFDAKDRSGALASMEPPHLGHVFSKILGA